MKSLSVTLLLVAVVALFSAATTFSVVNAITEIQVSATTGELFVASSSYVGGTPSWYRLCSTGFGSGSSSSSTTTARLVAKFLGFDPDTTSYSTYYRSSSSYFRYTYNSLSCPSYATSLSQCSISGRKYYQCSGKRTAKLLVSKLASGISANIGAYAGSSYFIRLVPYTNVVQVRQSFSQSSSSWKYIASGCTSSSRTSGWITSKATPMAAGFICSKVTGLAAKNDPVRWALGQQPYVYESSLTYKIGMENFDCSSSSYSSISSCSYTNRFYGTSSQCDSNDVLAVNCSVWDTGIDAGYGMKIRINSNYPQIKPAGSSTWRCMASQGSSNYQYARSMCNLMGWQYATSSSYFGSSYYCSSSSLKYLSNFKCSSTNPSSFSDCSFAYYGTSSNRYSASLKCYYSSSSSGSSGSSASGSGSSSSSGKGPPVAAIVVPVVFFVFFLVFFIIFKSKQAQATAAARRSAFSSSSSSSSSSSASSGFSSPLGDTSAYDSPKIELSPMMSALTAAAAKKKHATATTAHHTTHHNAVEMDYNIFQHNSNSGNVSPVFAMYGINPSIQ